MLDKGMDQWIRPTITAFGMPAKDSINPYHTVSSLYLLTISPPSCGKCANEQCPQRNAFIRRQIEQSCGIEVVLCPLSAFLMAGHILSMKDEKGWRYLLCLKPSQVLEK
eukprot:4251301-Amphidinium_carterae.1